jgi:predicted lipoprotein with Yx(FWY)xxD motif
VTRPLALGAAATAAMALLAGCGSSSSSSTTAASTAAATPTQSTATTTASAGQGLTVQTKQDKLGTILAAGPKQMTVYLFEADKGTSSTCSGACAKVWPPVIAKGVTGVAGSAVSSDLGSTRRSDGSEQVTYKGHPLYYYAKDGDAGDAYGQGSTQFGAGWYVLKPNGEKLDSEASGASSGSGASTTSSSSSSSAATTSTSSGGGYKY